MAVASDDGGWGRARALPSVIDKKVGWALLPGDGERVWLELEGVRTDLEYDGAPPRESGRDDDGCSGMDLERVTTLVLSEYVAAKVTVGFLFSWELAMLAESPPPFATGLDRA